MATTIDPIEALGRILRDPPVRSIPAATEWLSTLDQAAAERICRFAARQPPILGSESRMVVIAAMTEAAKLPGPLGYLYDVMVDTIPRPRS